MFGAFMLLQGPFNWYALLGLAAGIATAGIVWLRQSRP